MKAKESAAARAVQLLSEIIKPGMRIGVGTGSTVKLVLRILSENPKVWSAFTSSTIYASSIDTLLYLNSLGVHASTVLPSEPLDLYFDGADEVAVVQNMCQVLKGRGAAMTREKLFAHHSRYNVLVVDESKVSRQLGEKGKPVPVEVLPPALNPVKSMLEVKGIRVEVRGCDCRDGPAVTDNCGLVIDTWPWGRLEPLSYEGLLDTTPGVIGHGIFIGYFNVLIIGFGDGASEVRECRRTRGAGSSGSS